MSIFSTTALAFSMSADAFAVALCRGASSERPSFLKAFKTGALFGVIEGITPVLGWCIGLAASGFIASVDHWIAFFVLVFIGVKMIYESLQPSEAKEAPASKHSLKQSIVIALSTSMDALAVGVTLAFLDVNIWIASAAIGLATCVMVTFGVLVGQYAGKFLGKAAEGLGGVILVAIGCKILVEHLQLF